MSASLSAQGLIMPDPAGPIDITPMLANAPYPIVHPSMAIKPALAPVFNE